jgi:hypothetical protein
VAVLDSGVDLVHADLGGAVVAEACFCSGGGGCCPGGAASATGFGSALDDHGHGSNVAGVITSDGFVSPEGGAPAAEIVAVKVLDSSNSFCCSSDVIAGLDWVLLNHPEVDVVNLSLGTTASFAGPCDAENAVMQAYADAIGALRAAGVVVVASTGNDGSGTHTNAPACIADALAVAAAYDAAVGAVAGPSCVDFSTQADQVACYSNTNAHTDLVASGNPMTSAGLGTTTSTFLGTSHAVPLVSACAALLRQAAPAARPERIEKALRTSATTVVDAKNALAFPRLDCESALQKLLPDAVPALGPGGLAALFVSLGAAGLAAARSPSGPAARPRKRTRQRDPA